MENFKVTEKFIEAQIYIYIYNHQAPMIPDIQEVRNFKSKAL